MKFYIALLAFVGQSNEISLKLLEELDACICSQDNQNYYYPGGFKESAIPAPLPNHCVNVNKATGREEPCDKPGNSAWNTITTARTGKPSEAMAPPYPDHKLH